MALGGSPRSTHGVDVTDHLGTGVPSLRCHAAYLAGLGGPDPDTFLRGNAEATGGRLGVALATSFEVIDA